MAPFARFASDVARPPRWGGARLALCALLASFAASACADAGPRDDEPVPGDAAAARGAARGGKVTWGVVVDARAEALEGDDAGGAALAGRCASDARLPRFALGVCGDLAAEAQLTVDARPADPDGADVSIDGSSRLDAPVYAAGSFTSVRGIDGQGETHVRGSVRSGGDWLVGSPADVGGSALLGGRLDARQVLRVGGMVRAADVTPRANVTTDDLATEPRPLGPSLACQAAPDVAARVAAVASAGDAGDDAASALAHVRVPTHVTLGTRPVVVDALRVDAALEIVVAAPTTLVVRGPAALHAPVHVRLVRGGALDLLVAGDLDVTAPLVITRDEGAGATWVGVGGDAHLGAPSRLAGWLVVPHGRLRVTRAFELEGAALAASASFEARVSVREGPALGADGCVAP